MFKNFKIGTTLVISVSRLVFIAVTIFAVFTGKEVISLSKGQGQQIACEAAFNYLNEIAAKFERPLNKARALSEVFEAVVQDENVDLSREEANIILKHFIESNETFSGVAVIFLNRTLLADVMKNIRIREGSDKTGRFIPS